MVLTLPDHFPGPRLLYGGSFHKSEHILKVIPTVGAKVHLLQTYFERFRDHPRARSEREAITGITITSGVVVITIPLFMEYFKELWYLC